MTRRVLPKGSPGLLDDHVLLLGEVVVDSTGRQRIGDGVNPGGFAQARTVDVDGVAADVALRATTAQLAAVSTGLTLKADTSALTLLESTVAALQTAQVAGLLVYATKADIDADLVPPENAAADVVADGTAANNGRYKKVGATGTGSWTKVSDLAAVSSGATFDSALAAATEGGSGNTWRKLADYGSQPALAYDLSVAATNQVLISNVSNPHLRVTLSTVGGYLQLNFVLAAAFPAAPVTALRVAFGQTIISEASVTTTVGTYTNWAFGLTFSDTAPTLGGAVGVQDEQTVNLVYRGAGQPKAYQRDGSTDSVGVTLDPNIPGAGFAGAAVIRTEYTPTNDDCTQGVASWFADDALLYGPVKVTQPIANPWIGACVRSAGGTGDQASVRPLRIRGRAVPTSKHIHLHPDIGAVGGTGTERNPFQTLGEAMADASRDPHRRELHWLIKGGLWHPNVSTYLNVRGLRRFSFKTVKGSSSIRRASTVLSAGGGHFTLVSGNVWRTPALGALFSNRALLEIGGTQTYGRTGARSLPDKRYRLQAANLPEGSFTSGDTSWHVSGPYAANILVRMWNDGDPNAVDWHIGTRAGVLWLDGGAGGEWGAPEVELSGHQLEDGFQYLIRTYGCRLRADNMRLNNAMGGSGWELRDCSGDIADTIVRGHYGDCFHGDDSVYTDPDRIVEKLNFWNCGGEGALYAPSAAVPGQADTFSPHDGNEWSLNSCWSWGAAKSGVAHGGNCSVVDTDIDDANANGVDVNPYDGTTVTAKVRGGHITNCLKGVYLNGDNVVATAEVDVQGVSFGGNVESNIQAFTDQVTAQPLTIRHRNNFNTGALPSGGHAVQGPNTTIIDETGVLV